MCKNASSFEFPLKKEGLRELLRNITKRKAFLEECFPGIPRAGTQRLLRAWSKGAWLHLKQAAEVSTVPMVLVLLSYRMEELGGGRAKAPHKSPGMFSRVGFFTKSL